MTACKMAPESDRFRPTMAPTMVLGSRIFQIIWSWGVALGCNNISATWETEMSAAPKAMDIRQPVTARTVNRISMATRQTLRSIP